jgi:hypothetical protein
MDWQTELESRAAKVAEGAMPAVIERRIDHLNQTMHDLCQTVESTVKEVPLGAALVFLNELKDGVLDEQRRTMCEGYLTCNTDWDRFIADECMMMQGLYLDYLNEMIEITETQVEVEVEQQ